MSSQWTPRPASQWRARHRAVHIPAQRRPPHWSPPPAPASRAPRHQKPRRHRLLWFALVVLVVMLAVTAFLVLGSAHTQTASPGDVPTGPARVVRVLTG